MFAFRAMENIEFQLNFWAMQNTAFELNFWAMQYWTINVEAGVVEAK